MVARHRYGVDWKDVPPEGHQPYGPYMGQVYDVVIFDREDPLAPIKDANPTDPADVFVHLIRCGFRSDDDLFIALQQFCRVEGETWAIVLRDAMAEQLDIEKRDERESE